MQPDEKIYNKLAGAIHEAPGEKHPAKIKWRDHELALAGILALLYIVSVCWDIHGLTRQEIGAKYGIDFLPQMAFSYYRNVLFPHALRVLVLFVFLVVVNRLIIPRWLFPRKKIAGTFKGQPGLRSLSLNRVARSMLWPVLLAGICIVFFSLFIGIGWTISFYFEEQYLFNYQGFSFFPHPGYFPKPQIGSFGLIALAFRAILTYTAYLCVRETALWLIGRPDERRGYRVMILNQTTAFGVRMIALAAVFKAFDVFHWNEPYGYYFVAALSAFLVFMSNIYWLFPLKKQEPLFRYRILLRLLSSTLLCSFIFYFPMLPYEGVVPLVLIWLMQLLVVTPISWLDYQRRKDRIQELRGLEKALKRSNAEMQFLRSQINPHFLFNTLNTLYGTALQENAARTADGVQKLGDMMRFMLHDNNRDLILMSSEIEYLHNYIYLQKLRIRSSDGILIEDNIRRDHCDHMIAPMLLIPFVENAFKHGISLQERSWVMIDLHCDEKSIHFRIRNSVHARQDQDPERNHSGIGMKNVVGRLKLLYPGKFELQMREDGGEYMVDLLIRP